MRRKGAELAQGAGSDDAYDLTEKVSRIAKACFAGSHGTCKARPVKIGPIRAGLGRLQGFCAWARSTSPDVAYGHAFYLCLPSHRKLELPIKGLSLHTNPFQQSILCFSPHLSCVPIPNAGMWRSALLGTAHWASVKGCAAEKKLEQKQGTT
jgi:hypothetical protein